MYGFFRRRIPPFENVLLVESGSREILDQLAPRLQALHPQARIDLVTCYGGAPREFREATGRIYRVGDYPGKDGAQRLVHELRGRHYHVMGIICAGQPIMTRWKWLIAAAVNAKLFVINENGDFFWADYSNWRVIQHFIAFRLGMSGADAVITPLRLLIFPFGLAWLAGYAGYYHLRKRIRLNIGV